MLKLKELRKEKGLTQKEIGKIINCNQTAVGKYERGELEPSLDTLKKLADFFNCSIDYLVGCEDEFGVIKSEKTELPGNTGKTHHTVNSELFAKKANKEETISKRIKELRLEKGLTQKEIAKNIDSTVKNVWAYENNLAIPPIDVLSRYADFFCCSIDYLVGREDEFGVIKSEKTEFPRNIGKARPTAHPELFIQNTEEEKVLAVYRNLSTRDKDFFMRFVDTLNSFDKKA